MPDPLTELLEWHRDEISAAAMFDDLALGAADADCAAKWRTLARAWNGMWRRSCKRHWRNVASRSA